MRAMIIFCALAITGCANQKELTQTPTPPQPIKIVDNSCKWVKFITVSPSDSLETKKQIFAHDLAYNSNCKGK